MDDVAAVAGVSRGTVSRVLNGGHNVSKPALDAVQRPSARPGTWSTSTPAAWSPSAAHSVAFVLSEPQERLFEDPNFHVLLRGCTQSLAEQDITLLMTIAGTQEERRRVSRYVTSGHVDGALLVSTHMGSRLIDDLRARGVPVVACGRPLGHERDLAYVAADDRDGARQMVQYLRSRGREVIATITGPLDTPAAWTGSPATRTCWARPTRDSWSPATTSWSGASGRWSSCSPRRRTSTRSSSPPT